jgi:hypothetical protein
MFLNLTYYEIHGLIAYARDKFATEPYRSLRRCGRSGRRWLSSTRS